MKTSKFLPALILSAVLVSAGSASAVTLYPSGVTEPSGLTLTSLTSDGWIVLSDVTYATNTSSGDVSLWQSAIGTGSVFVGAYDSLTGNIIVGATGLASEVLSSTGSLVQANAYSSSNLYWYNVADNSFGFTPTENIFLYEADITSDAQDALRLSWHTISAFDVGGWRAGEHLYLNDDQRYHKVVLSSVTPTNVPDGGSTLAMFGLAAGGLMWVKRRGK